VKSFATPGLPTRPLLAGLLAAGLAGCGPATAASPSPVTTTEPTATTSRPTAAPTTTDLPAFAPDAPLILYALRTDIGGGIFVMKPDGTDARQLATDILPGVHKAPDWSPDGQSVTFVDEATQQLWIAHLDGSPTEQVRGCEGGICDNPAWSPDGTRIAFVRIEEASGVEGPAAIDIEVVDVATGLVSRVVRLERPLLADAPRWSPDGNQIVFQVDRLDDQADETGAAIAIVAAAGGEPRYLAAFEQFASAPDWGWVTDEIVFSVELLGLKRVPDPGDETWNLHGVRPDGSEPRRVTSLPDGGRLLAPRWSPGGSLLIAKEFEAATMTGGGRRIDPTTGEVAPFVTGLEETRPLIRPVPDAP
jgi:Tol biopolymer transport system component